MSTPAAAGVIPAGDAWSIYRRLLKYAMPYLGVFLIGVPIASLSGGDNETEIAILKGRCGDPYGRPAARGKQIYIQ